jgi:hypothetical protein
VRGLREDADKQLRALLTPEQQVKFDAMKALRSEGRMGLGPMGEGSPGWHGNGRPPVPQDEPPSQE